MGFFDRILGRAEEAAAAPQPTAVPLFPQEGNTLQYDPMLIPQLVQEHHGLLRLFGEIKDTHAANDFAALKRALQKFQLALNLHLAQENANFYAYLRKSLSRNSEQHNTMSQFWDEMQDIGKVVTTFLRTYNHADFTPDLHGAFGRELDAIGAALVSRIEREEASLYKLYVPA
jgi:regulator of sigma D